MSSARRAPPAFPRGSPPPDQAVRAAASGLAQFIKEPQDVLLILGELGKQDLDRGAAPDFFVDRFVHSAHAALAKLAQDAIVPNGVFA